MAKVTGEGLTDAEIEHLRDSVGSHDRDYLTAEEQRIVSICNVALIEDSRLGRRMRERVAEIINTRTEPTR